MRDYVTKQLWKQPERAAVHKPLDPAVSDTEDEEELEKMERFEKDFNFRFEEEEGDQVQRSRFNRMIVG